MRAKYAHKKCYDRVPDCGTITKPKSDPFGCHLYYKCDGGKAYSCQNPKWFHSTCSQRYFSIGKGKAAYACHDDTFGAHDCKGDFDYER